MSDDEEIKPECPAGSPLWMCTFADLMSLLLCFFVLLLSFSVMDAQQYKEVAGSMKDAFGVQTKNRVTGNPYGQNIVSTEQLSIPLAVKVQEEINDQITEEVKGGGVKIERTREGVLLRVKDSLAFDSGMATLKAPAVTLLAKIGKVIAPLDVQIEVSGHTDNVPINGGGPFTSNWSLSTARAVSVVEYWTNNFQVPAYRLSAVGYAEGQPLELNDTPEGRAANRRVEIKIQANQLTGSIKELSEMLKQ